jgi:hypothetical protein
MGEGNEMNEQLIAAAQQALEALERLDQYAHEVGPEITALRTAIEQAEKPKYDPIELHVLHSHIAGVLFDFMGWLTSREKRLTLSNTDEAGPAVEAITEFAKMRGLSLQDAQVEHWQEILITPPAAPVQEPRCAVIVEVFEEGLVVDYMSLPVGKHKLYTHSAPAAPVQEPSPGDILFAVEQAIRNGHCPWEIENAFDEYEAERREKNGDAA